jgi:hypothetical protein
MIPLGTDLGIKPGTNLGTLPGILNFLRKQKKIIRFCMSLLTFSFMILPLNSTILPVKDQYKLAKLIKVSE